MLSRRARLSARRSAGRVRECGCSGLVSAGGFAHAGDPDARFQTRAFAVVNRAELGGGGQRFADAFVAIGLLGLAIVACWPVIASGPRLGFWDWDLFEALLEAARKSVREYGQWPGWNPYLRGGESFAPHPLQTLTSPSFLVVLAMGTLPGIKTWVVVRQLVALLGAYSLGRRLAFSRTGAIAVAVAFGLASCYAQRVAHGHWNLQALAYLPLCVALGMRAVRPGQWRSRAGAAVVLALTFLDGGPYVFASGVIGLGVCAVVEIARSRNRSAIGATALMVALALAISGAKLVPVVSVFEHAGAAVPYGPGVMLDFYDSEFAPSAGEILYAAWLDRDQASRPDRFASFFPNVGAYLGPLGLLLVVVGLALSRVGRIAGLIAVPLIWICLGQAAPINLWALLHQLPVIDAMRVPAKFTPCTLLAAAVVIGAGVDALVERWRTRRVLRWAPAVAVALFAIDLLSVSRPVFAHAFPTDPIPVASGTFHQRAFTPYAARLYRQTHGSLALHPGSVRPRHAITANYPAVVANFGVLHTLSGNRNDTPAAARPDTGGVLTLEHTADARGMQPELIEWTPNRLRIRVDPARGGRLVVNANFDHGWHAESDHHPLVVSPDPSGRLSVALVSGQSEVVFRYHSSPARWGALVSVLGLGGLAVCYSRGSSAAN